MLTPRSELDERLGRLQDAMRREGLDGVFATQNADVFYLSGIVQQAQVYVPGAGNAVVMVRKHRGRALDSSTLDAAGIVGVRSLRELAGLVEGAGGRPRRIGFELDTLPVSTFNAFARALDGLGAELVDASAVFRQVRSVKSEFELAQIRRAGVVGEAGYRAALAAAREGVSEAELAADVEAAQRRAGHSGTLRIRFYGQEMHMGHLLAGPSGGVASFMNSPTGGVGIGPWAPYGAGAGKIRRGEPLYLDYPGEWGGYIADMTRVMFIGECPAFWRDGYEAMLEVERHLEREVKPGLTSGDVFELSLSKARELGYADFFMGPPDEVSPGQKVAFIGHGVGLELDELPPLQKGTTWPILEGMVLAIEPKLIYPGRGAIGIEDTYVVTPEGLRPLTPTTRELAVL
jgi:Xaa-Pro aminopeptidase